jgi:hypothetical protein
MGFDVLLAGGTTNRLFGEDLMGCLVEVRIEQSLSEPTKFAVRFLDDIEDGKMVKASVPELKIGQLIAVAVDNGEGYAGLVRGPILRTKAQMTLGGPGSSFQVEGIDRRDELSRDFKEGNWTGRASDVAMLMLTPIYPGADVGGTTEMHDPMGNPLPQRGSDLDFLKKNAAENGFHFWVTYEGVAEIPGGTLTMREVAHWKESPPLQDGSPVGAPPVIPLGDSPTTIRYHVPQDQCPNITKFDLSRDGDAPNQVRTATQNTTDGGQDAVTETDPAAPLGGQGQTAASSQIPRFLPPRPQGNAQATRTINQAVLREAGFYVKAEVATTRYLLGSVLEPHQVVAVEGLGGPNGTTPFRVESVTHVINGQAHFMQAKLATNAEVPE